MTAAEREHLRDRIRSSVIIDDATGCWRWQKTKKETGYGQIRVAGRTEAAHRIAYEAFVGPIPAGRQLDHLCHNESDGCAGGRSCVHRSCVNPEHLELVSLRQNLARRDARRRNGRRPLIRPSVLIAPGSERAARLARALWRTRGAATIGWRWS